MYAKSLGTTISDEYLHYARERHQSELTRLDKAIRDSKQNIDDLSRELEIARKRRASFAEINKLEHERAILKREVKENRTLRNAIKRIVNPPPHDRESTSTIYGASHGKHICPVFYPSK